MWSPSPLPFSRPPPPFSPPPPTATRYPHLTQWEFAIPQSWLLWIYAGSQSDVCSSVWWPLIGGALGSRVLKLLLELIGLEGFKVNFEERSCVIVVWGFSFILFRAGSVVTFFMICRGSWATLVQGAQWNINVLLISRNSRKFKKWSQNSIVYDLERWYKIIRWYRIDSKIILMFHCTPFVKVPQLSLVLLEGPLSKGQFWNVSCWKFRLVWLDVQCLLNW